MEEYLFPVPLLPPPLQAVNRLLTCGKCDDSNYVRNDISTFEEPDLTVWYRIFCLNPKCRRIVLSKHTAMEAETLFEAIA